MPYDSQRNALAVIDYPGLSVEDIDAFCQAMGFQFHAVGCPAGAGGEGWDDASVFRVSSHEVPARGYTVRFDKVLEWKAAMAAMGPRVFEGGSYRHYKGGLYTTVCEATEEASGRSVVVYRQATGPTWTRPTEEFFGLVNFEGKLTPRFTWVAGPL